MKLLTDLYNRVTKHWVSSLFGFSYLVLMFMFYKKEINVTEFGIMLTSLLGFKGIFLNKDDGKVVTKPEVKNKEAQP